MSILKKINKFLNKNTRKENRLLKKQLKEKIQLLKSKIKKQKEKITALKITKRRNRKIEYVEIVHTIYGEENNNTAILDCKDLETERDLLRKENTELKKMLFN